MPHSLFVVQKWKRKPPALKLKKHERWCGMVQGWWMAGGCCSRAGLWGGRWKAQSCVLNPSRYAQEVWRDIVQRTSTLIFLKTLPALWFSCLICMGMCACIHKKYCVPKRIMCFFIVTMRTCSCVNWGRGLLVKSELFPFSFVCFNGSCFVFLCLKF